MAAAGPRGCTGVVADLSVGDGPSAARWSGQAGWPVWYTEVLEQLHQLLRPAAYLEIGVARGNSLRVARSPSIGVDPAFDVDGAALANKPWVKLYRATSDEFFHLHLRDNVLEGQPLELSFIDGLHLFEHVLRDLRNVERWSSPAGVVVLHDVLPPSLAAASRAFQPGAWVGDVWRIVPCLATYRPDLRLRVIDAPPSGLLVISGLDPANSVLTDQEAAICAEFLNQPEPYEDRLREYLAAAAPLPAREWLRQVADSIAL